jgi:T-complex protein 1 subunit alpha
MESKSVVVGGGCVEAALSIYLENFATSLSSREQLAIADFAKSLLVIPKVTYKNTYHIFLKRLFTIRKLSLH